ncbi:MAG TPA: sulfatase-like hydrolase/transferase [Bryobacteraceae bacterium]|nr:sulfatase-like hydrolase/transferase [Bryobacteraceae bacterium]
MRFSGAGVLLYLAAGLAFSQQTPVILISIDTLRADHLSAYGYRKIRTPHIDSFAQGGTLFRAADCQIPLTLPSHTSLFTSTYPFENRIEENAEIVPPGAVTLASVLRSQGYRTGAFIGSVFLEQQLGLGQGFDVYDSPFHFEAFSRLSGSMFFAGEAKNPYAVRESRLGLLVAHAAARWLSANRSQPVFAFVHLFDMHKPYRLPPGFARPPGTSDYDAELEYVDQVLGWFRQALEKGGWWERSLVALLADHGESLGEHGEASHGYFVYESTLRVPLIVHWPAGAPKYPAEVQQPAGLIDVAPTILDFLHLPLPASFEGQSLLRGMGPASPPRAVYAESVHARDSFGWAPLRAVRLGEVKYIDAPKPELYDLKADPQERNNLVHANPAQAAALRARLKDLLARSAPRRRGAQPVLSEQSRALLGSLGYLAPGPQAARSAARPDPKDRLPEFRLYEDAMVLLAERRLGEAAAALRRVLAMDPHNILARRDLGATYLEAGAYEKASVYLREVTAAVPDDYMTRYELGVADERLGRLAEAKEQLEAACRLAPAAGQCQRELDLVNRRMK